MPAQDQPSPGQCPDRHRILVEYDKLFANPILPPAGPDTTPHNPDFLSRHGNAIWWLLIFAVIIATAAVLFIGPSDPIVDPPCE